MFLLGLMEMIPWWVRLLWDSKCACVATTSPSVERLQVKFYAKIVQGRKKWWPSKCKSPMLAIKPKSFQMFVDYIFSLIAMSQITTMFWNHSYCDSHPFFILSILRWWNFHLVIYTWIIFILKIRSSTWILYIIELLCRFYFLFASKYI
jgi:hypothetical protein